MPPRCRATTPTSSPTSPAGFGSTRTWRRGRGRGPRDAGLDRPRTARRLDRGTKLQRGVRLHLELRRATELANEPTRERHQHVLATEPFPRPSGRRTDRVHRSRGELPARQRRGAGGQGGDPVMAAGMLGAGLRPRPAGLHQQCVHEHAPRRAVSRDGDVPVPGSRHAELVSVRTRDPSTDAGIDASVMYHEYTHGLSNRLVIYPEGSPRWAPNSPTPWARHGATGTGSTVGARRLDRRHAGRRRGRGQVRHGRPGYQIPAADCDVDSAAVDCPAPKGGAGPGGYTYGDYAHVFRAPNHIRTARSGCRRSGTFAKPWARTPRRCW